MVREYRNYFCLREYGRKKIFLPADFPPGLAGTEPIRLSAIDRFGSFGQIGKQRRDQF